MQRLVRIIFGLIFTNFILWNWAMPVFEPADESGHYAHILYIWKQGRLPNLAEPVPTEKGVGYTTYSPLYYLSLIPLAKLADAPAESEELLPYHPQKELFKKGVYAVYLHTRDELFFKWNRLMAAVHLLRLQTSMYGLLTVYLVYLTGKKLFGEKSLKPLAAAALVGLNPMFAHVSNSIVNVNLGILLFSLFFYLAIGSLRNFRLSTRLPRDVPSGTSLAMTGSGVIAGLAYLTKITGLILIPIWIFLIVLVGFKIFPKKARDRVWFLGKCLCLFSVGFLLIAGWYLVRNVMLYGNLLETSAAIKHFGRPAAQLEMSGPINYWTGFVQTNFKTFFSGYGMVTVNLPDTVIYLLAILAGIGVWGILLRFEKIMNPFYKSLRASPSDGRSVAISGIAASSRLKVGTPRNDTVGGLFLGLSAVLILLMHVFINLSVEAFHARDLFIGMVPFSLLFVLGMETWWKKLKAGRLRDHKLIYLLMSVLVYVLTVFHFQQQALVGIIKSVAEGRQILLEHVLSIAAVTVIFVLGWRFCIAAGFLARLPDGQVRQPANQNNRRKMVWGLIAGLFAANLIILFGLVIPRLYQL